MDFQSAMETFAEAWVAANTQTPLTEAAAAEAQALAFSRSAAAVAAEGLSVPHESMADKDSDHEFESVPRGSSLRSPHPDPHHSKSRTLTGTGKSMPVHCIVEQVPSPQNCDQAGEPLQPTVELDSYAIIPSSTLFCELVRTGLLKLGYTQSETIGAKGAIHIKNWKPLSFDMISDEPEATVGEILGELTTVATLRIRLYSTGDGELTWNDASVRCAVIELLTEMSQSALAAISPFSQSMISSLANSTYPAKIGKVKCKEFGEWYSNYRKEGSVKRAETSDAESGKKVAAPDTRFTFHPIKELPLLREWYRNCRSPSDVTLQAYVGQLNKSTLRLARSKVTLVKLKNWFKNERQREKRLKSSEVKPGRRRGGKTKGTTTNTRLSNEQTQEGTFGGTSGTSAISTMEEDDQNNVKTDCHESC